MKYRVSPQEVSARDPSLLAHSGTKTVLMVDYYFPPMAGAGVHRTLGYVRHLAEFGWSPIVLTVSLGDNFSYDPALLKMVPDTVNIQRTFSIEPVGFVKGLLAANRPRLDGLSTSGTPNGRPWMGPGWMRRVEGWVLFPDRHIGWLPFAVARAVTLGRSRAVDVVYSTSTSITSHLIALTLKRVLRIPWVADFQDWWVDQDYSFGPAHRKLGERIESLILRNADQVTFTTEPLLSIYRDKYRVTPRDKLGVISLGFHPEAFRDIQPVPRAKFTITHFGNFYRGRSPVPFLEALAECAEEDRGLAQDVEVLFFGSFDAETIRATEALIDQRRLKEVVRLGGVIPYRVGLQHLMSSDVLLLVAIPGVNDQIHVPAKLFDYLATGRPILALTPEGPAAQIVRAANAGIILDPENVGAIRGAISDLYASWKDGRLAFRVEPESVRKFSWKELTGHLASTLEKAHISRKQPRRSE